MKQSFLKILGVSAFILGANAQALEFDKPITATITLNNLPQKSVQSGFSSQTALPLTKTVVLMNIKLTRQQKRSLNETLAKTDLATPKASPTTGLPRQYDRGMNNTPVLDQGMHGTCATFANTAAVDALLGKGDYISQLCTLELGAYFEKKGYLPSGWDGSMGSIVLNQITGFGIINKTNQKTKLCGGLADYPAMNPTNIGSPMSLDEFKQSSENLNEQVYWDSVLSFSQRFAWDPTSTTQAENVLSEVKTALATQKANYDVRLTVGALLMVDYCDAGACARYHANNDTWALTAVMKRDKDPNLGGHEMVITGYNDDAVAIDNEGNKHQGLLTLRNSWGTNAGDKGNYYMTYDYFKQYVIEVQKIVIEK